MALRPNHRSVSPGSNRREVERVETMIDEWLKAHDTGEAEVQIPMDILRTTPDSIVYEEIKQLYTQPNLDGPGWKSLVINYESQPEHRLGIICTLRRKLY